MYFIKAIIDFIIVLLLIRLLITPVEVNFNQIFSLIYRITDPILSPAKNLFRNEFRAVLLSVFILGLIRGLIYIAISPMPFISGAGLSFLNLFQLLFQFYMVVWFISVLSNYGVQNYAINMVQRAFHPISSLSLRLGISKQNFSYFSFGFLLILYSVLSFLLHLVITFGASFSYFHSIAEGLRLIIALFPIPGIFSIIIIAGVLLSWVSPDPYNPIVQAIYGISEPFLAPFRRLIPSLAGLDFSPLIALFCFNLIGGFLLQLLDGIVRRI